MSKHEVVMTNAQRLVAYDRVSRHLIPGLEHEVAKNAHTTRQAIPAALNGSLRDLATFIIASRANENSEIMLQAAKNHAHSLHPMSRAEFGK